MNHVVNDEFDIIVVGAGMIGASLACALGQLGMRVAVVDTAEPKLDWPTDSHDMRVSAITRASQNLFDSLGAWTGMMAERVSPYQKMHVWDASGSGVIDFDAAELGQPNLGHIIENRVIVKALHGVLDGLEQVEKIWPAKASSLAVDDTAATLRLADGRSLTARLVIGADGGRSWVREQAGIGTHGWDYDHTAVVTYVKTEKYHQDTAWQRFLPTGPLAFLPLTEGYSSIVWSTSAQQASQLVDMEPARFALQLQAAFENTLGRIESVGPRAAFALRYFETDNYIKPRLALVGDAAHMMHPLAGQGVNLGLADVRCLRDILAEAGTKRKDPGSRPVLRKYERARRADNRSVLMAMDGLKWLFSSTSPVVRLARNTGLNITNRLTPLKNAIIEEAMGI